MKSNHPQQTLRSTQAVSSREAIESEVSRRFKKGQFDLHLLRMADRLDRATQRGSLEDPFWLKCRSLVCEIRDWSGRTLGAQNAVREGGELSNRLQSLPISRDQAELCLAREQVRFVADYARVYFYREQKYERAREYLQDCSTAVSRGIASPHFPSLGTQAQISYFLGCAFRQLGELALADAEYGRSIELYRARAAFKTNQYRQDAVRVEEELAFARHRTGIVLGIGHGWVNYTRGFLNKALVSNITPAQVLLMGSADSISNAHLSLIRGSILRSLAGHRDSAQLIEARTAVAFAHTVFTSEAHRHDAYAGRAAIELALVALYGQTSGRFEEAEKYVSEAETLASASRDVAGSTTAWIVRSRIARARGEVAMALKYADSALKSSARQEQPLGRIDALIAKGEALQELGNLDAALKAFEEALAAARRPRKGNAEHANPKIEGVLAIHLARNYVRAKDVRLAQVWLDEWRQLRGVVEHVIVHERAADVERELSELKPDFTIRSEDKDLTYRRRDAELRRWLVLRARSQTSRKQDIADRLAVSRVTLASWEKELRLNERDKSSK